MLSTDDVVAALPEEDAWTFLRGQQLGRLAYHLVGEVHIVPVNYAAGEGRIVFRTAPGSKLLGVVMHDDVAFEVDLVDQDEATSVVVRGSASLLRDDEAREAEELQVRSWVPTDKDEIVAIEVHEISGRRFRLDRG